MFVYFSRWQPNMHSSGMQFVNLILCKQRTRSYTRLGKNRVTARKKLGIRRSVPIKVNIPEEDICSVKDLKGMEAPRRHKMRNTKTGAFIAMESLSNLEQLFNLEKHLQKFSLSQCVHTIVGRLGCLLWIRLFQ